LVCDVYSRHMIVVYIAFIPQFLMVKQSSTWQASRRCKHMQTSRRCKTYASK